MCRKLEHLFLIIKIISAKNYHASISVCFSSHPTSSASIAEILSVLFFNVMRYSTSAPRAPNADRFILSKGHACPALYAAWSQTGLFPESDCMTLRKIDSDLEGHPTPVSFFRFQYSYFCVCNHLCGVFFRALNIFTMN